MASEKAKKLDLGGGQEAIVETIGTNVVLTVSVDTTSLKFVLTPDQSRKLATMLREAEYDAKFDWSKLDPKP